MGADKALVRLGGKTLLERVARTAVEVSPALLVLGRDGPPPGWPADLVATFLADAVRHPEGHPAGPMPALLAQLERLQTDILLLACDMPLLTASTLRRLIAAHAEAAPHPVATVATTFEAAAGEARGGEGGGGRTFVQPALAVYTPAAIAILQRLVIQAKGSFQPLLREPGILTWPVPAGCAGELLNVNTPEALAQAEAILTLRRQ
jgi:molybdopterin-guanine dinucleotide biosynthesis protein A